MLGSILFHTLKFERFDGFNYNLDRNYTRITKFYARDEDGTLTGLKQSSDADFNARTKEQEALKAELEKAGITAGSGSFEQGDPNYRDDSLDAYTEFGVSYDKSSDHWMYGEKPIYILYDKEHYTFCDKGVSDGVSLNVVRDKAGNIEKLVSVDKGELEQFVK